MKDNNRIIPLEGIRGLAVLMVMSLHAHFQLGKGGGIGVDIFFVLSGFLITKNLLQEYKLNGFISLKKFWVKRFFRLFPPLFILLLILFIFSLLLKDRILANSILLEIRDAFFYVSNLSWLWSKVSENRILGHTWSLSVENQFYIIWPLFIYCVAKLIANKKFIACITLLFIILSFLKQTKSVGEVIDSLYFESIFFGCVLSIAISNNWINEFNYPVLAYISLFTLIIIALFGFDFYPSLSLSDFIFLLVPMAVVILILNSIFCKDSLVSEFLSVKPLVYIGSISYGLYLWHIPIFRLFKWYSFFPPSVSFILKFAVTFLIASLSYFLLEKRMLKISKNIISNYNAKIFY